MPTANALKYSTCTDVWDRFNKCFDQNHAISVRDVKFNVMRQIEVYTSKSIHSSKGGVYTLIDTMFMLD